MTKDEWSRISPLTLAHLGDTAYEMYVRSHLVAQYPGHTTHELHRRATRLVRASAQAYTVKRIMDELTEEEASVFRRGRNMHNATVPKHANIADYRAATGFEAVLGYLYLQQKDERLNCVLDKARELTWEELESWAKQT